MEVMEKFYGSNRIFHGCSGIFHGSSGSFEEYYVDECFLGVVEASTEGSRWKLPRFLHWKLNPSR